MKKSKTIQKTCCCEVAINHLRRMFFMGLLLAGVSLSAIAQINISGTVVDAITGETLPGVNVVIKDTNIGTVTNFDGKYSIAVPDADATLVFSFMGYITTEIQVGDRRVIDVQIREDATQIEEVVVVGYGAQKKINLTGAVVSVNVEQTLGSRPIADVGRGLQGSVPGLSVIVPTGEIGSDPLMKIRGQVASPQGSANPLILLDNVEIPSIQVVNPDDIESISVLKDAASASIYGAKAAFGVILITTKKGARKESISVTYSNNFSWQNRAKELNMAGIDGLQYTWDAAVSRDPNNPDPVGGYAGGFWRLNPASIQKSKEWIEKYGKTGKVKPGDPFVYGRDFIFEGGQKYGYRLFDAVDCLVANWTPTQTHNLSVNGMSGKTSFNMGLGLLDQTGMNKPAKIDDFKRYNVSMKVSTEMNKYLTLRAGALYSDRNKRYPSVGSSTAGDPWLYAYRWGPLSPVGVKDQFGRNLREPAFEFANTTTSNIRNVYMNINLGATINISNNWNLQFDYTRVVEQANTNYSIPMFTAQYVWYAMDPWIDNEGNEMWVDDEGEITTPGNGNRGYVFPDVTYAANGAYSGTSSISRRSYTTNTNAFNLYSTYNLTLHENHVFKFMAGMDINAKDWEMHFARRLDLTNYENPQFNFATGAMDIDGDAYWDSQVGFFGRANYAFRDKYLLEANLRYGGSSKFPTHLQWQWFPSFSAGWVVTGESFMDGVKQFISFAKLRASWGQLGDQSVGNNLYLPLVNGYDTNWLGADGLRYLGFRAPSVVSSDIKWQVIQHLNLGVDTRFWQNRLGITFEWFLRDTKDMIIAGDTPPATFGAGAPQGNYGDLRVKGFEVVVDFNHRFSNGVGISAMVQLSDAVIHTTKGADWRTPWEDRSIGSTYATGSRYGDIWGYVTDRLYQEDDFVKDTNGKMVKETIIYNGTAKETYQLSGSNPVYQTWFEDGGGVVIFRPGDCKFVDLNGDGYITSDRGTFGYPGDRKVIGNSTPRYEYGARIGADYKGFDFSIFVQGVGSRQIWGSGQLAIPGYHIQDGAMPQAIAGNYWRPDRTDAFYPRPWHNGGENTNYSLQVQSRYLLNMAYTRIKNISLGYTFPQNLLKTVYLSKARVYVSLENFFTFDNLRGLPIDPEAITGYSMFSSSSTNLTRTGMNTPVFKSVSAGVQISF